MIGCIRKQPSSHRVPNMAEEKHTYELTYIINSVLNEKQTQDAIRRVSNLVDDIGGEVVETDEWGSRRLAYSINKRRNGYYVTQTFEAPGENLARLERSLRIDDDILRYLLLRVGVKMQQHHEAQKQQAARREEEQE